MDKKIRSMIDAIFSDMKMSAENLALRDELIANALARYEDSIMEGESEEEAFAEVASSLADVRSTLIEMEAQREAEASQSATASEDMGSNEFVDAVSKAFDAIGDFGKQFFPQVGRLAQQADEATGKVFSEFGKAVGKGAVEVGRVAGETFEKISKNIQEAAAKRELSEEELLARAKEIRIQAEIRQEADDQEGARLLRKKAYELEVQAEKIRKEKAARSAEQEAEPRTEDVPENEAGSGTENTPVDEAEDADFVLNNDVSADILDDAESIIADAVQDVDRASLDATVDQILEDVENETKEGIHLDNAPGDVVVINRFNGTDIHGLDVGLDSDDVEVVVSDSSMIEVEWTSEKADAVQPVASVVDSVLKISRKNPDVFKTFFSVFKKEGGKVVIRVPADQMLTYKIGTTSGDISLENVLSEEIHLNATSGKIRVVPAMWSNVGLVQVNSVSGEVDIRANANTVSVATVSGNLMFEGNAEKADLTTVSGKIHTNGSIGQYEVESVSGNALLECRTVPTGKVGISSVSGSAKVVLPASIMGFKAVATGIGGIASNEFGPNNYGTCELPICFDSMSGRLMIVQGNS